MSSDFHFSSNRKVWQMTAVSVLLTRWIVADHQIVSVMQGSVQSLLDKKHEMENMAEIVNQLGT